MTDEYQIDNVTWAEKEGDGNIVVDSDVVSTDNTTTRTQNNRWLFAEQHDGGDADIRLSNAVSAASAGDVVFLERGAVYTSQTISKEIGLKYLGIAQTDSSPLIASGETLTISSTSDIEGIDINGSLQITGFGCDVENAVVRGGGSISVEANQVLLDHIKGGGSVTFASGTADGDIGIRSGAVSVTDNGDNST